MTGLGMYLGHDPGMSDAVSRIAARTRCGMFHSEALAKAIHDDRVRQIERTSREHRLLQRPEEIQSTNSEVIGSAQGFRVRGQAARSGSACEPA